MRAGKVLKRTVLILLGLVLVLGIVLYVQAIEQTNPTTVTASNPNTILFSK